MAGRRDTDAWELGPLIEGVVWSAAALREARLAGCGTAEAKDTLRAAAGALREAVGRVVAGRSVGDRAVRCLADDLGFVVCTQFDPAERASQAHGAFLHHVGLLTDSLRLRGMLHAPGADTARRGIGCRQA